MTYMGQLVSECGPYYCQSQLHWARLYFSSIETGKECVASGLFCTKAPSSSLCSYMLEPQLSWAQCPNWVHCVIWYDSICHNLLLTAALEFVLSPWVTWQGNEMEEGAQLPTVLFSFFLLLSFFFLEGGSCVIPSLSFGAQLPTALDLSSFFSSPLFLNRYLLLKLVPLRHIKKWFFWPLSLITVHKNSIATGQSSFFHRVLKSLGLSWVKA